MAPLSLPSLPKELENLFFEELSNTGLRSRLLVDAGHHLTLMHAGRQFRWINLRTSEEVEVRLCQSTKYFNENDFSVYHLLVLNTGDSHEDYILGRSEHARPGERSRYQVWVGDDKWSQAEIIREIIPRQRTKAVNGASRSADLREPTRSMPLKDQESGDDVDSEEDGSSLDDTMSEIEDDFPELDYGPDPGMKHHQTNATQANKIEDNDSRRVFDANSSSEMPGPGSKLQTKGSMPNAIEMAKQENSYKGHETSGGDNAAHPPTVTIEDLSTAQYQHGDLVEERGQMPPEDCQPVRVQSQPQELKTRLERMSGHMNRLEQRRHRRKARIERQGDSGQVWMRARGGDEFQAVDVAVARHPDGTPRVRPAGKGDMKRLRERQPDTEFRWMPDTRQLPDPDGDSVMSDAPEDEQLVQNSGVVTSQPWHFQPNQDRRIREDIKLANTEFCFVDEDHGDRLLLQQSYRRCETVGNLFAYAASMAFRMQESECNLLSVQVGDGPRFIVVRNDEELFGHVKQAIDSDLCWAPGREARCIVKVRLP